MKFRDLAIGQKFDFCIVEEAIKRIYMPAVKTGNRKYRVDKADAGGERSVPSINIPVFNVQPLEQA